MPIAAMLVRLARPFAFTSGPEAEARGRRAVELVRLAFGLLLAHRSLDMAGFAILADDPASFAGRTLAEAVLGLVIAVGVLTPLALATLLVGLAVAPLGDYLALQVVRMLALGLLLAGAGRRYSADAWLLRRPALARAAGPLYGLALDGAGALAFVRLLLVALFGSLTLFSVRYHAADALWRSGDTLQVALLTPYFSPHYEAFTALAARAPGLLDTVLTAGLAVQGLWQVAFFPLFYAGLRSARVFAVLQGLAFFLLSTFLLNLGYLGPFELLFWTLVFGSDPRLGMGESPLAHPPEKPGRGSACLLLAGLSASALFAGMAALSLLDLAAGTSLADGLRFTEPLLKPFGLRRPNVFNRADLNAGSVVMVLLETDEGGRPLRTVPVLDRFGGRLDWLRNDHLYSFYSLPWQRASRSAQFVYGKVEHPSERTLDFVRRLVDLDLCLSGFRTPRYYRAELLTRALVGGERFPRWTEPRGVSRVRQAVGEARAERVAARLTGAAGLLGCYDLPPGHAGSARRAQETLAWAQELESP